MINVSHDRNHRWAWHKRLRWINDVLKNIGRKFFLELDGKPKLIGNELDSIFLKTLVNRNHESETNTLCDNFTSINLHEICKFADSEEFCCANDRAITLD